jgi:2-iminobutanoate/2-iminopropanoate deaminase
MMEPMSSSKPRIIEVPDLPPPRGHYAYAVEHGGVLYLAGQLGRAADMTDAEAGDIARQTRFCLEKIEKVLRAANSDLSRLLKVNVTLVNVDDWPAVNAVYAEVLGAHRPARAVIAATALHFGALIEIEAIAAA